MIKLKQVTIHKFKCIEADQTFEVEPDITVFVGMNESGKTSVLQSLAKSRYFSDDPRFSFNSTHDYPRKEKKRMDKSGKTPNALTCTFSIGDELAELITADVGEDVLTTREFKQEFRYDNLPAWIVPPAISVEAFARSKTKELGISSKALNEKLAKISSENELDDLISSYQDEKITSGLRRLENFYTNKWGWSSPICEYIARVFLEPELPKFLYYDEYYALPSRVSIEKLMSNSLEEDELKTAKALFELADIDVDEVIKADDFEDFKAELEATEATITEELFEYWSTNTNLEIQFAIDKIESSHPQAGTRIVEHVLDIRVRNNRTRMTLPLRQRSKGFNWFFSFLVWFKKIQEDSNSNYILLLDEPGLNLHASAQKDLLQFIEDLASNYQLIYTTHSPFMVNPGKLNRVRTIVETATGSRISDSVQEKDPDTLFPLQAALGYDLAQNLFVSRQNLLVEGVSDLIYLQHMSSELEEIGRTGLRSDVTIVPMGGLEKVSTFVSLLRGSSLTTVCLLDSSLENSSKAHIEKLVREKIIKKSKIRSYDEFTGRPGPADIEDMFDRQEYLMLLNSAFSEYDDVSLSELDNRIPRVVEQINRVLGTDRFNHYRPARKLLSSNHKPGEQTLDRFEQMFSTLNKLF